MSVVYKVVQKKFFKKKITLEDITGGILSYGKIGPLRLEKGVIDERDTVFYNKECIGRGINTFWPKQKKKLEFYINLPSTKETLDEVYNLLERVSNKLGDCIIYQDDEVINIKDFKDKKEELINLSYSLLEESVKTAPDGVTTFFGALFPIYFGPKEKKEFEKQKDMAYFSKLLHEKQSLDVYYAQPQIFQMKGKHNGIYSIVSNNGPSVLPKEPFIPFMSSTPAKTEVDWYISLYSLEKNEVYGLIPYADFIKEVEKHKPEYFDEINYLVPIIEDKIMKEWYEKYQVTI
jgi:hypothetical protein